MEKIKKMIADGQTQKALSLLNEHLANHPEDDQAWFLKGNAYRKLGETRLALNSYLEAIAINPDSPARLPSRPIYQCHHRHVVALLRLANKCAQSGRDFRYDPLGR